MENLFFLEYLRLLDRQSLAQLEGQIRKIPDSLHIINQSRPFIDNIDDSLHTFGDSQDPSIFKDRLHNFRINLIVSLMMPLPPMKRLTPKGNDLIDDLHDILSVIPVLPIADIKTMIPEELEFIAASVIYLGNLGLDPLRGTTPTVLRILMHDMVEYFPRFLVDKSH